MVCRRESLAALTVPLAFLKRTTTGIFSSFASSVELASSVTFAPVFASVSGGVSRPPARRDRRVVTVPRTASCCR